MLDALAIAPGPAAVGRSRDTVPDQHSRFVVAPRGFCAGVRRAIDAVRDALAVHGPPVYVRRPIVHNSQVVRELEAEGAIFVEELEEVPARSVVIFSAHGVSPDVAKDAVRRNLTAFDAVAVVSKVPEKSNAIGDGERSLIGMRPPEVEAVAMVRDDRLRGPERGRIGFALLRDDEPRRSRSRPPSVDDAGNVRVRRRLPTPEPTAATSATLRPTVQGASGITSVRRSDRRRRALSSNANHWLRGVTSCQLVHLSRALGTRWVDGSEGALSPDGGASSRVRSLQWQSRCVARVTHRN